MVRKFLRIMGWTLAAILALLVALAVYLRNADLSVYDKKIEAMASRAIGHELTIDGLFELRVGGTTQLVAEDVTLRNPAWSAETELLHIGHLQVEVDHWSLLKGPFVVEKLVLRDVAARVTVDDAQRSNWATAEQRVPRGGGGTFDVNRIAFREVSVDTVSFTYTAPGRRRPLDLLVERLTIAPDANDVLDINLLGAINELPLRADGRLGPWQNLLDGRNIEADLEVALADLQLLIAGAAKDLPALAGVSADARLSGPDVGRIIERLGLPPFAAGAFVLETRVVERDAGHHVRASGNLGNIEVFADGTLDRFIRPRAAQFEFNIAGPDTKYVAELFGVQGAPAEPFRVSGDLTAGDGVATFKNAELSVGQNTVKANGSLRRGELLPDGELLLAASGPNFSVLGPFLDRSGLPVAPFKVTADVRKQGDSWRINAVDATVGENEFEAKGSVTVGRRTDNEIVFRAAGPDIAFLEDFTALRGLPEKPFAISARLRSDPDGIAVDNAAATFGDNRVDIDGVIAVRPGLVGSRLNARARGPELRDVAVLAGIPYLPAGPFDVGAGLQFDQDLLRIADANARVGELTATVSGVAGLGARGGFVDLDLAINGPDATQFVTFDWLEPFSGEAFAVTGGLLRTDASTLSLQAMRVEIGGYHAAADGIISMSPASNDSDLRFSTGGPSLARVGQMFGLKVLKDKKFSVTGAFAGTTVGFEVQDFTARVGESDLHGDFAIDLRGKPRVSGTLQSEFLDLSERLAGEASQPAAAKDEEPGGLFFSDEPINAQVLQAANVDVEVQVARFRGNTLDASDLRVGVKIEEGALLIAPFSVSGAAGHANGRLIFKPVQTGYELDLNLAVRDLYAGLLAGAEGDFATLPPISGQLALRGIGASVHDIMASSNGRIAARQGAGEVKRLLTSLIFGDVVTEVLRTINPLETNRRRTRVDCGIYDVSIVDGLAILDRVAVQTDGLQAVVSGSVNLKDERLNLAFRTKPREGLGITIGTVANSFLTVRGTLKQPRVVVDPKSSMTATGAAVATGGLSLVARSLWNRVSAEESICGEQEAAGNK